jgi:hypothetical protein
LAVEQVEFLAGLEADGLAGSDADLSAGSRVAADPGLAGANIENTKTAKLNALTFGECPLEGLENSIDGGFGFVALQPGPFNHVVNDVLFYQGFPPSGDVSDSRLILETFNSIVNAARVS